MRVLICGGAGYIGSHSVQLLKKQGHTVVVVDDLSTGHIHASHFADQFYQTNILDLALLEKVFIENKFDAVFHFAAKLSVPESFEIPYEYIATNVTGTSNLLRLCAKYSVEKFIFSSTAAVYGEPSCSNLKEQVVESDICKPINHYGLTKKIAEELIHQHSLVYSGFKYKILRYFNVSGAAVDGSNGPRNTKTGQLVLNLCHSALKEKKIKVFGNQFNTVDGTCVRDYIHVHDLAMAHLSAYENLRQNKTGIWNCGYGVGYSVLQVIRAFEKVNNIKFDVEICEARKGDPACIISNNTLIKSQSNWTPQFNDLEQICKSTYDWVKRGEF